MIKEYEKFYTRYLSGFGKYQLLGLLILIIYSMSNVIYPVFLQKIIDDAIAQLDMKMLTHYTLIMTILIAISIISKYIKTLYFYNLGRKMGTHLKNIIITKIFGYDNQFGIEHKPGEVVSIIEQDIGIIQNLYMNVFNNVLANIITAIGLVVITLRLNYIIAVCSFILVACYMLVQIRYGNQIKKIAYQVSRKRGFLQVLTQEILENSKNIHLLNCEHTFSKKYNAGLDDYYTEQYQSTKTKAKLTITDGIFEAVNLVLVLFLGGILVVQDTLSIGALFTLTLYVQKLFTPIITLMGNYIDIKGGQASIERVTEITESKQYQIKSKEATAELYHHFKIVDLNFSYDDNLLFENVNMLFEPGDKVAFIGENGTGKSTLINIMFRLEKIKYGILYYNGVDINDLSDSYYEKLILLPQRPFIFNGTLKENILVGKYQLSDIQIYEILKLVNFDCDVIRMKDGLDTMIGNNGIQLSGGQAQKVALARIFLEQSNSIIVLDEPTSALDIESEQVVMSNLVQKKNKATIIIVTHRKKILDYCNKIMSIENKQVKIKNVY